VETAGRGRLKTAVVVGGGLGGLATALRLRMRGWAVTVFEAGPTFGGKMNRWEEEGFRFDTGPSLITMPWVFEELFENAGGRLKEHAKLTALHPLAEYFFADGARFTYSASLPEWIPTLQQIDRRDVDGFFRFMHMGARLYEVSRGTFLQRSPYEWPRREDLGLMRHMPLRHGWGNYHRTVESHFKSPYLRQMFDRYPTYVGSSPYRAPATLSVIPYMEYAFGGYCVEGGLYRIVEGLLALARAAGVELVSGTRVESVMHSGAKVTGLRLEDGETVPADVVVMNGDASAADALLGEPGKPREASMSGFVMLLGIAKELPRMQQHSIYFSSDYAAEFSQIFDAHRFPDDPTVYVNVPSRGDRSLAPRDGETLFIMANAPAAEDGWDAAHICEARRRVFARLRKSGFPDIEQDIVVSDIWTPRRIADRYLMPGGSIYGAASHGWRNSFLRPPNRSRKFAGLYYVGGSTHPGGGTPMVLLSAKITCESIERHC
jgi:phytoene desaturase